MGCFSILSLVKVTSASSSDNSWHPSVTPEIQTGSVLLYLNGISSVHQYLQKPYTSAGLMCQAIEPTQSSTPAHPFPPPGRRNI